MTEQTVRDPGPRRRASRLLAGPWQDMWYALRILRRNRVFAAATILTLALGMGATTAVFSIVNGVLLRPLPYAGPDRLVQVYETAPLTPEGTVVGGAYLQAFRENSSQFDGFSAYQVTARYLRQGDAARRLMAVLSDRQLFAVLGASPMAGRTFSADDPESVVVISEAFWNESLGHDPAVIGRTLTLDERSCTIIGVMPDAFQFPYRAGSLLPGVASEARIEVWLPVGPPGQPARGRMSVVGRLRTGAALLSAERELARITSRVEATDPGIVRGRGVRLVRLANVVVGPVRRPLLLLCAAVAMVLALACANIGNLALVRMTSRQGEVAVRAALGAGPILLVRQFLTESLLLSLGGGTIGLVLAVVGTSRLMVFARAHIPRAPAIVFDWQVFLFLFVVCLLAGLAFGLVPALIARRTSPQSALQEGGLRGTLGPGPRRLRDTLVVAEVSLAFVLAIAGALLVRELLRLRRTDPGIDTHNVITVHVGQSHTMASSVADLQEIAARVAQLPGVSAAGFTQLLPLQNWGWNSSSIDFTWDGSTLDAASAFPIELRFVTPGYFAALGMTLRSGRAFTDGDTPDATPVIVINETLARRVFGPRDPVGTRTSRGTVVGVTADVRQVNLDRTALPEIYYPIAQNWSQVPELGMSLVVRVRDARAGLVDAVRAIIHAVNPQLAIFNTRAMDDVVADSLSEFTLYFWLMLSFALLALVLATTGTYGVIAHAAAARNREFAIRMAVGADRAGVARLVLAHGTRLTLIGLACGLGFALAATPLLRNLPVAIRPPDLATTLPVALLIAVVALIGSLVPARRAARADPMIMLRNE